MTGAEAKAKLELERPGSSSPELDYDPYADFEPFVGTAPAERTGEDFLPEKNTANRP